MWTIQSVVAGATFDESIFSTMFFYRWLSLLFDVLIKHVLNRNSSEKNSDIRIPLYEN